MEKSASTRRAHIVVMSAIGAILLCAGAVGAFRTWLPGDEGPPQQDMTMNAAARKEVLDSLISALNQFYVYPEKAAAMERALRAQVAQGEIDKVDSAEQFAKVLTEDLQSLVHDRHLEVRYFEAPIPVPAVGQEESPEDAVAFLADRKRLNFGFETVGRLKFNIGYIDLHEFSRPEQVASRIEAAMTLLGDTRSLIIDLRRMHGGDPETVMLMASYLFDRPTHLNDIYWREGDRIESRWTQAEVTGLRYGQSRPIVILTSSDTFSAGEDFAYALKHAGRAILVGETTGGGGHPGSRRRLTAHFMMNVPTGRAINPVTKTDWEGVGVTPDIAVSAKNALDVAQVNLLNRLLAVETDPQLRRKISERLHDLE